MRYTLHHDILHEDVIQTKYDSQETKSARGDELAPEPCRSVAQQHLRQDSPSVSSGFNLTFLITDGILRRRSSGLR